MSEFDNTDGWQQASEAYHRAAGVESIPSGPTYDEQDEDYLMSDTAAAVGVGSMQIEEQPLEAMQPKSEAQPPAAEQPDGLDDLQPEPTQIQPQREEQLRSEAVAYKQMADDLQKNFYDQTEYYIISARWLKRWKVFVSYEEAVAKKPSSKYIGAGKLPPINQDIIDNKCHIAFEFQPPFEYLNQPMRAGLKEGVDYHFISTEMWKIFTYQHLHYALKRLPVETMDGRKVQVYFFRVNAIVMYNQALREIEGERLKKYLTVEVQFPQYKPLPEEYMTELTKKVKKLASDHENVNPAGGYYYSSYSSSISFSKQNLKVWTLPDDMDERLLKNYLHRVCKANSNYNYKVFFGGEYLDPTVKSMEELQVNRNAVFIFELLQMHEDWCLHNKKHCIVAKCENCKLVTQLKYMCSCQVTLYCSPECKSKDKYYHRSRCDRDCESSEDEKEQVMTEKSRRGIVGLRNLGNTCFMNSGIQCITSIDWLTQYFLEGRYLPEINVSNPIGTKGELSKAYAKVIQKMWYGEENSLAPTDLKRAIGKFQPMFLGYDQHDSGELISYLLDGLHEDLNRVINKPYTQMKDYDGRPDEIIAKQNWQVFLKRNQSVIVDMMYGQYKSRLQCPKCDKISITFDPFLMCPLPIPQKQVKTFELLYVQDKLSLVKVQIPYEENSKPKIKDMIDKTAEMLGVSNRMIAMGVSFYETKVLPPDMTANEARKEYKHRSILFRPLEAEQNTETDLPATVTQTYCNSIYGNENYRKSLTKSRVYLFKPETTAKQVHDKLYEMFGGLLTGVTNYKQDILDQEPADQKWRILLVTKSMYEQCHYCGKLGCENCQLPYTDDITVKDLSEKCDMFKEKHRLEFEIYYRKDASEIERTYQRHQTVYSPPYVKMGDTVSALPSIYDCFKMAQQPQILGEDNAWYCPTCKDFVLASKQMQIYKAPRILILYFKRFKNKGYKGLYQSKLSTVIDFPIDDLDITKFVLNHELPEDYFKEHSPQDLPPSNHYSLFAISNHFGGLGGGHYTAYCRKQNSEWYEFDDSSVSTLHADRLVDAASYVLFYRRKDCGPA